MTKPDGRSRRSTGLEHPSDRTDKDAGLMQPKPGVQFMVRVQTGVPASGRVDVIERDEIARTLGVRLRELRAERKMGLRALERRSGVNRSTLSRLEHGLRRPRISVLGWISYGLDPDNAEALKRELCAAAGGSLIAESRWSARMHTRKAWRAMLGGTMPLPPWLAAPRALTIFGTVWPDRRDMLLKAQEVARRGALPWPDGVAGSTEVLALANELMGATPGELARIGRMMAAADAASGKRERQRRGRELRASLGLPADAAFAARERRLVRGLPAAERHLVDKALAL